MSQLLPGTAGRCAVGNLKLSAYREGVTTWTHVSARSPGYLEFRKDKEKPVGDDKPCTSRTELPKAGKDMGLQMLVISRQAVERCWKSDNPLIGKARWWVDGWSHCRSFIGLERRFQPQKRCSAATKGKERK